MTRRNLVTIGIAIAVAVSFLFVGVGAVAADDGAEGTTGLSGHCSNDANGGGGGGYITVDSSPSQDDVNTVDGPGEAQSIASALVFFGQQKAAHPQRQDTCDGGNGENSYDYLEAHVGPVQACYSEDNAGGTPPGNVAQGDACH